MLLLGAVAPNSTVLDVGCARGYLGCYLRQHKQARVWGIEPYAQAAADALASGGYEQVVVAPVESALVSPELAGKQFDVILLADVLEHLSSPDMVLNTLTTYTGSNGMIVVSLPNVAHYSVRLSLLFGKWTMRDSGIMDRTHLHFYTQKTMRNLLEQHGWSIDRMQPRGDIERWFERLGFGWLGRVILSWFPGWWAVQFVLVARRDTARDHSRI